MAIAGVGSALQVMFLLIAALERAGGRQRRCWSRRRSARAILRRPAGLARQSLIWSVICLVPLAIGGLLLARTVVGLFGLEPEVAQIGARTICM